MVAATQHRMPAEPPSVDASFFVHTALVGCEISRLVLMVPVFLRHSNNRSISRAPWMTRTNSIPFSIGR